MTTVIGRYYEHRAKHFLQKQGLQFIAANFRNPFGEIDLIMRERLTLIFVEVKYRKSSQRCSPLDAISKSQQRRLILGAEYFLLKRPQLALLNPRFDAVAITGSTGLRWIKDAFSVK